MFIFIPLAHRLGLYEVKSEMENIWLRYKEPEAFNDITAKINRNMTDKEKEIDDFIAPISTALKNAGFNFEIRKRVKTAYSIWHKMVTKGITFDQVYDLYAVRIIFTPDPGATETERDQCYHVFSIITDIYRYKPDRVRDWVKHPKNNGYEALHCTLMSHSGIWIEVQIRTRRMDDIAEKGIAAHWAYKKDGFVGENESEMDKWISKVKEILVNPDVNALELLDIIHNDLNTSDIFVFTPKGDQKRIQKGATALDFAYSIHSHIGNTAIAAKVNMKLVPLSYVLKGGDQVEIITAETESPKQEWLQFLQTRKARSIVMDYLKSKRNDSIRSGRKMLEEQISALGYKVSDKTLRQLLDRYGLPEDDVDELYFRIGIGVLKLNDLDSILKSSSSKSKQWLSLFRPKARKDDLSAGGTGADGRRYITASCCSPIPGDSVVGFLGPDGTVTVHKKSCPVANNEAAKHGDRIVVPDWEGAAQTSFLVRLSLKGLDRIGIINEITRYISFVMSVNIRRIDIATEGGVFDGVIDLYVHDKKDLDKLTKKLSKIEGIQSVVRSDI